MSVVAAVQPPHVAPPSCDLSTQKEEKLKSETDRKQESAGRDKGGGG